MKRSFPPPARGTLGVLVGALVSGAACTPNHDVKPGAPELIEFNIVQAGPGGPSSTMITPDTPECSAIATGDACLPAGKAADADAGTTAVPPDAVCRLASASNWCGCIPTDPMNDPTVGAWNCDPFPRVLWVIAVFDRLLDTAPLDPGDAGGLTTVVTATAGSPATALDMSSNYSATGDSKGIIFNAFGPAFFGNFRADGPSLLAQPQPEFPSSATVTVNLDASMILAKDGKTPFSAGGLLTSGSVVFTMAPFTASVIAPDFKSMTDPLSAAVMFTNFINWTPKTDKTPQVVPITVTSNGADFPFVALSGDNADFTITPDDMGTPWPSGATIVITVPGTTQNLLGQTIDMAHSVTFTAP